MEYKMILPVVVALLFICFGAWLLLFKPSGSPVSVVTTKPQSTTTHPLAAATQTSTDSQTSGSKTCTISQTAKPSADWVNFNKPQWDITFKYPPTWKIKETDVPTGTAMVIVTGDAFLVGIRRDQFQPAYEEVPYQTCDHQIAGQAVTFYGCEVGRTYACVPNDVDRSIFYVISKQFTLSTHNYNLVAQGPSSSQVISAIFNSLELKRK